MTSDYRVEAAAALDDPRWLALTDSHARLYRNGDYNRGRAVRQADERDYINDTDLARMLADIELLGLPRDQTATITRDGHRFEVAGFGQPALMRAWLIQALTGRRASEVLMMDFHPLRPIPGLDVSTVPDGGMVAKLRYQQTKVNGAPETILVGADVVSIVAEQQDWVRQQWNLSAKTLRYLFPKSSGNRHASRPWETSNYSRVLREFSVALALQRQHAARCCCIRAAVPVAVATCAAGAQLV